MISTDIIEFSIFPFLCCRELARCALVNSEFARIAQASERLNEVRRVVMRKRNLRLVSLPGWERKLPVNWWKTTDYCDEKAYENRKMMVVLARHGEWDLSQTLFPNVYCPEAYFATFGRYWKVEDLLKNGDPGMRYCLGVEFPDKLSRPLQMFVHTAVLLGKSLDSLPLSNVNKHHMRCYFTWKEHTGFTFAITQNAVIYSSLSEFIEKHGVHSTFGYRFRLLEECAFRFNNTQLMKELLQQFGWTRACWDKLGQYDFNVLVGWPN